MKKLQDSLGSIVSAIIKARNAETATNLPHIPAELEPLAARLGKTDFTLVVSGEVNRGKSTFINAIIGQDVLPTFDRETTSQVFKIRNSPEESCHLVLDDGSRIAIQKDELKKYGTELVIPENGDKLKGKQLLYIEVSVPIANLPAGVTIVDTPGIGSTYKQHTIVAKSFMQEADAIIYLCSAKHPIVKVDVDFIKSTILPLPTYPNVLFVMAKADLADSTEALQQMLKREAEQLEENFADCPTIHKKVIPVNSLALSKSNRYEDSDISSYLRDRSNYDEVNKAIHQLIEKQHYCWLVATFNCAAKYYKRVNQYLEKQISAYDLNETARKQQLDELGTQIARFEEELGSKRQAEIGQKIEAIISALEADIKNEFKPNKADKSELIKKYQARIDAIKSDISTELFNEEAQSILCDLADDSAKSWERLCSDAQKEIQSAVRQYSLKCQIELDKTYDVNQEEETDLAISVDVTWKERIRAMRSESMDAGFGVGLGVAAANGIAAVGVKAGLASVAAMGGKVAAILWGPVGAGAVLLYGVYYGIKKAKEKAFLKAKSELQVEVKNYLDSYYDALVEKTKRNGTRTSILEDYTKSLRSSAVDAMSAVYIQTRKELENARKQIIDSANPANRIKLVNQQTLFNKFAIELKKISSEIKLLNTEAERA